MQKKLILVLFILLHTFTYAYDAIGHRIISDIAYANLTPKVRKHVDKVLGTKGIIYYSTWADEVRSDDSYKYSYQWHYQNLKDDMTVDELKFLIDNPAAEGEHLFYALDLLSKRIKTNKNDKEALKFLVHFIGDLHQPMHLGRKDDLGGNRVPIKWFGRDINIHGLWDTQMLEARKMSYTEFSEYLQLRYAHQKADFLKADMLASVKAGYAIRNKIYAYTNTNNYHYLYNFNHKLDTMLYRGGLFLASYLNELYK